MTHLIPIFYTRGLNPPYTEGHIKVVRTMIKSLLLRNVRSIVFNYKYRLDQTQDKVDLFAIQHEKIMPLLSRDAILSGKGPITIWASLAESLLGLDFIIAEKLMTEKCGRKVTNLVNSFRYFRALTNMLLKSPMVFHFYMSGVVNSFFTRIMTKHADAIISSSYNVASFLETLGIDRDKISVIYPPVDTTVFKPVKKELAKLKVGFPQDTVVLLCLGSLRADRFPEDIVLDAMKKLIGEGVDARLFVFAQRNRENNVRAACISKKIEDLELSRSVRLFNRNLGDLEKNLLYNASDILLFPAFKAKAIEPPLTVLEAMATGLPAICSDSLSIKEFYGDSLSRFLVPIERMDGFYLAEKISSLLEDRNAKQKFSEEARRKVLAEASVDVTGSKLIEVFESLF